MTTFFWTKYPFVRVGLAFILGIFLAYYFLELLELKIDNTYLFILYGSIVCVIVSSGFMLCFTRRIHSATVLLVLFASIGFFRFLIEDPRINRLHLTHTPIDKISQVIGSIHTEPIVKNNKISYTLAVASICINKQWQKQEGYIKVYSNQLQNLTLGQHILLSGKVIASTKPSTPYDFNFAQYLAFQKIYHIIYSSKSVEIVNVTRAHPFVFIQQKSIESRIYIERIISRYLVKENNKSIVTSLLTGNRLGVSQQDKDLFTNSGTIHILAISGMHIVLIFQLLVFACKCFRLKATLIIPSLLILFIIWFYIFICGLQASTVRAGVMLSIVLLGNILHKTPVTINSLFAAAFIMLLYNPYFIADIGFCLSFFAVVGICIFSQFTTTKKGFVAYFKNATCISTGAQLTTLPYSIFLFQQFPTYFLIANLLVVPLATVLLISAIALVAFHHVPLLSTLLVYITNTTCDLLFYFLHVLNKLPLHLITRISLSSFEAFIFYLLIAFILIALFSKKKIYIGAFAISCILFASSINIRLLNTRTKGTQILISGKGDLRQYLIVKNNSAYLLTKDTSIAHSYPTQKFLTKHFVKELKTIPLPAQANFSIRQNHEVAIYLFRNSTNFLPLDSKKTAVHIIDYKSKYSYLQSSKSSPMDATYTLKTETIYLKQL